MKHVGGSLIKRKVIDSSAVLFIRKIGEKNSEIQILLAKRKDNLRAFPGLWSGIGGKVSKLDKEFIRDNLEKYSMTDVFKATAIREVYEEINLLLLKRGVLNISGPNEITLQEIEKSFTDYDWGGLILSGFKETPEFSLINPIFKAQYFIYELNNSISDSISIDENHPEFETLEWKKPLEWISLFESQQIQIPPPVLSVLRCFDLNLTPNEAAKLSENKNNRPIGLQTEIEIHPGIYGLPLPSPTLKPATTTNCFLLGDNEHRYIIDPGSHLESEKKRLLAVLEGLNRKDNIKGIILTHNHIDHWSSIPYLLENLSYSIPIFAHELTESLINNEKIKITNKLSDEQIIDLGYDHLNNKWNIKSIYTGGHAPDHFTFLDNRFNALIAGDFVAGTGTVLIENMGNYLKSLDKFINLNIGVIMPAHGPIHHKGHQLLQKYKDHRLARLDKIIEAFSKNNKATVDQLTEYAYQDVDKQYHQYAKIQVKTYLKYLEEENRVENADEKYNLLKI